MNQTLIDIVAKLRASLATNEVLTDDDIPTKARTDMSGLAGALPAAVLRPSSVKNISTALKICAEASQSIVPQGGLSGLAGGAVPKSTDIALSLERFSGVESINAQSGTMTVRAGTILEDAQNEAAKQGFLIPVDLGARGSATIGGMIATNAGGIRVLRHGMMRDNILGLEVVLADGTILSNLSQLVKNNTGYDLKQLFIGSEGTLGIITRAVVKLQPIPASRQTALCAVENYESLLLFLHLARSHLSGLAAFEVMWQSYFDFNQTAENAKLFSKAPPFAVIVENETLNNSDATNVFGEFLGTAFEQGILSDGLIAQSDREAQAFWAVREGYKMFELLPHLINFDVSIAIDKMNDFTNKLAAEVRAQFPDAQVFFFGHLADCNLHIGVDCPDSNENTEHQIDEITYGLVAEFSGSVSAEHGIGLIKRPYLNCSRSPTEMNVMRLLKTALDPNGILNPGKVL